MAKKKRDSASTFPFENEELLEKEEELIDEEEDEEPEDNEAEDLFEEDEDDLAMIEDLERADEDLALSEFFFEEELGYNHYYDWSTLRDDDGAKYNEIINMSEQEVAKTSIRISNHFHLWTLARACQRYGLEKKFQDICLSLLKARKPRPELCYEDIHLELIQSYAHEQKFREAFEHLEKFLKNYPDSEDIYHWAQAFLLIDSGKIHEGKAKLDKIALADLSSGRALFEIAMTLISLNHPDLALNYLERAKHMATMNANAELTTDIDLARDIALRVSDEAAAS